MTCKAGGGDEALAQGLLSLVGYGPVIGEDPALQLVQVGGGELHATSRAVPVLVVASLQTDGRGKFITNTQKVTLSLHPHHHPSRLPEFVLSVLQLSKPSSACSEGNTNRLCSICPSSLLHLHAFN